MSNESITAMVAASAAVFALAAYVGLILVPAWTSYSRIWQRMAAAFLSLYVLATLVGIGAGVGAGVVWFSDRL